MHKVSGALLVFSAFLLGAATAGTASAALITDNVSFTIPFTNGTYGGGAGPTFSGGATPSAVSGSFSITFDPTLTYNDDTVDINDTVLTGIATDSEFAFDYSPTSYMAGGTTFAGGELVVGGVNSGACCVELTPVIGNDFYLQILNFTTSATFLQFGYTTSGDDYFYTNTSNGAAVSGAGSVIVSTAAVPEPGNWLLLVAGLSGLAGASRRKRLRQV